MASAAAPRTASVLHLAPRPSWKRVAHDILCGDPLNVLDRLDAAAQLAVDARDDESEAGLAATAMTWMLVDWARFTHWREWVQRFERADGKLAPSTDADLDLARAMGAAACALLRGDSKDLIAPFGERLDGLMATPCSGPQRAMQLYLAAGALLPWRQISGDPAGAQALHGRMAEVAAELPATTQGAVYLRGAWLASWALYLHHTDRVRLPSALQALDGYIEQTSAPLLKFRSVRLVAEQAVQAQNVDAADRALRGMLEVLHPARPMERVIYNTRAAGSASARKDADNGLLHLEHMARDLTLADCPPSVAITYQQSAWRVYYALGDYEKGAEVCDQFAEHAQTQYAVTLRGVGAFGRALHVYYGRDGDGDGEAMRQRLRAHLQSGLAPMRAAKVFSFLISLPETRAVVAALALREGIETEFVLAALKLAPVVPPAWADEHWPWAMSLRCFGGFQNVAKIAEGQSASKASSRPLNLLMLIAAHGAQGLTVASASDALWPELDADQAENTLSMTLLRLRRLHSEADLIQRNAGWLHLNPARVWTDVMALEAHLDGVPEVDASEAERMKFVKRLFDLYRGDCLKGVDDDWARGRAAHYRGRVTLAAQHEIRLSIQADHYAVAEHTATRAFERGLDVTRLLNAVHPDQRATVAWTQLQRHVKLLESG
ncbi:MAG: hypothetical protein ABIZ64_16565 [Casimicrobium sp.]